MSAIVTKPLEITSPSFKQNDFIPVVYTCEGKSINPAISIKNIPARTRTLAVIVEDPDAPRGTFDHWVVWNIPPLSTVPEGRSPGVEGKNSSGGIGYTGPCPPAATGVHHYHFQVYALDAQLKLKRGADKLQLKEAMKNHILSEGELIGLAEKKGVPSADTNTKARLAAENDIDKDFDLSDPDPTDDLDEGELARRDNNAEDAAI
jgi:Raf kinase inhibitor-like YbhB/YbcL family protein